MTLTEDEKYPRYLMDGDGNPIARVPDPVWRQRFLAVSLLPQCVQALRDLTETFTRITPHNGSQAGRCGACDATVKARALLAQLHEAGISGDSGEWAR